MPWVAVDREEEAKWFGIRKDRGGVAGWAPVDKVVAQGYGSDREGGPEEETCCWD